MCETISIVLLFKYVSITGTTKSIFLKYVTTLIIH